MRGYRLSLVLASAAIAAMALAPVASATPRSGAVHIVKDCIDYRGAAGQFCTITSSNVPAIPAGARIVYASAAQFPILDTDISIAVGPGNVATGHCRLNFLELHDLAVDSRAHLGNAVRPRAAGQLDRHRHRLPPDGDHRYFGGLRCSRLLLAATGAER